MRIKMFAVTLMFFLLGTAVGFTQDTQDEIWEWEYIPNVDPMTDETWTLVVGIKNRHAVRIDCDGLFMVILFDDISGFDDNGQMIEFRFDRQEMFTDQGWKDVKEYGFDINGGIAKRDVRHIVDLMLEHQQMLIRGRGFSGGSELIRVSLVGFEKQWIKCGIDNDSN